MTIADLSPNALAQLEAKLVADLEMVRRVRALLEEHQGALSPVVAPMAVTAAQPVEVEQKPHKSPEQCVAEALETLIGDTFRSQDLRQALRKQRMNPDDGAMRLYLNRLLRAGSIVVVQAGVGRGGSTYRKQIPVSDAPAPSDSTVSPPSPTVSPLQSTV